MIVVLRREVHIVPLEVSSERSQILSRTVERNREQVPRASVKNRRTSIKPEDERKCDTDEFYERFCRSRATIFDRRIIYWWRVTFLPVETRNHRVFLPLQRCFIILSHCLAKTIKPTRYKRDLSAALNKRNNKRRWNIVTFWLIYRYFWFSNLSQSLMKDDLLEGL